MTKTPYAGSATSEYLNAIREHVIRPLDGTQLSDHCFAASMLIFAAIDGLGKLIHEKADAGAGDRFKGFLPNLGDQYRLREDDLWDLRNSLDHNAINRACYMSKTDDARGEHLEVENGHLFVHTVRLFDDFRTAVDELEKVFQLNPDLFRRAEGRLEFTSLELSGWRDPNVQTTPPPVVRFRYVRERKIRA
jgi:hypothetical protein